MSFLHDVDNVLKNVPPTKIIIFTVAVVSCGKVLTTLLESGDLVRRSFKLIFSGFRKIANPIIRKQVLKASKEIKFVSVEGELRTTSLPKKSISEANVLNILNDFHKDLDLRFEEGKISGTVYHGGAAHTKFVNEVMNIFQWSNPLHSDIFGATRKMEAEVVSMVLHMFHGHLLPDGCGVMTSGGTESIVMAMRAYKCSSLASRGLEHPSVLAPVTIHPAFDKAADYFHIRLIKIPVRSDSMTVDVKVMEKYMRPDTIAIVGSACCFPYGTIDPIEEMSELALRYNVGLHVDSCLGGFVLPFLPFAGRKLPVCDFRLAGVTSISCDTHKYGYAPKGTSTVLYRTKNLRSYQFCTISEWPGGMYCSPAVSGSKPGNVIAGTWASMMHFGLEGYVECAESITAIREFVCSEIEKIPYLYIFGKPLLSVFAFSSDSFDIFEMAEELKKRGWVLNHLQFPSGLQFSMTMLQTQPGVAQRFISDLKEIGDRLNAVEREAISSSKQKKPKTGGKGNTLYGSAQRVPDRTIIQDVLSEFLSAYYTA